MRWDWQAGLGGIAMAFGIKMGGLLFAQEI